MPVERFATLHSLATLIDTVIVDIHNNTHWIPAAIRSCQTKAKIEKPLYFAGESFTNSAHQLLRRILS